LRLAFPLAAGFWSVVPSMRAGRLGVGGG
jgi:hypothetical protein